MSPWHWSAAGLLLIFLAAGCSQQPAPVSGNPAEAGTTNRKTPTSPLLKVPGKDTRKENPPSPSANPQVTVNQEAGILSGVVRWQGAADPQAETFTANADQRTVTVGGRKVTAQPTPRLEVNAANQGIANTVVWLRNPPSGSPTGTGEAPSLRQVNGNYRPHVQVAPVGSRLELTAVDDQANFRGSGAADFNLTLLRGKHQARSLSRAGLVTLQSDIHPWLSAYIWVMDHGYHAVTDADGRFRLPPVPPGEYEVAFWHEGWRVTDPSLYTASPPVQTQAKAQIGKGEGAAIEWKLSSSH
jgi:hypothetical protein